MKFNPFKAKLQYQEGGTSAPSPSDDYVRPSEWPDIEHLVTNNTMVGLYKVIDRYNGDFSLVTLHITCPGGSYTVDWGDGDIITYASGAVVTHAYLHSNTILTNTSYGYKCAVVKVTATTNITAVSFVQGTGITNSQAKHAWLDIDIDIPTMTSLLTTSNQGMFLVEQFNIRNSALTGTSLVNLFSGTALKNLKKLKSTGNPTSLSSIFRNTFIKKLKAGALDISWANVTTCVEMFAGCINLEEVEVGAINTVGVLNLTNMFNGCISLESMPANVVDTTSATNVSNMFYGCTSLKTCEVVAFPSAIQAPGLFSSCISLEKFGVLYIPNATSINGIFQYCSSLVKIDGIFCNSKAMENFFAGCTRLEEIGYSIMGNSIGTGSWGTNNFSYCFMLSRIGFNNWADATNMFPTTSHLWLVNLGGQAINEIFSALPPATGTKVLNISGCYGKSSANIAIATAKGWTITV